MNFPFICSNIPVAHGLSLSQMILYSRACGSYDDFLERGQLLTGKLLNQGFLLVKLKPLLRKIYGHHHDFINHYGISVSQITTDIRICSTSREHFPILSSFMTYHQNCYYSSTTWVPLVDQVCLPFGFLVGSLSIDLLFSV